VVEIGRGGALQVGSVLDYIGNQDENNSLFNGHNINKNGRKTSGLTRFPLPIDVGNGSNISDVSGSGMLINVTSEHVNFLTTLLASEFSADVVTAPQVVTLNGQNVEFISGRKLPFPLGLQILQGSNKTTQDFFYKNVGTYISVTPRIVNWGRHAEMSGQAPIMATDIEDWNGLVEWILNANQIKLPTDAKSPIARENLDDYLGNGRPLPYETRRAILKELSNYPGNELRWRIAQFSDLRLTSRGTTHQVRVTSYEGAGPEFSQDWELDEELPAPSDAPVHAGVRPILRAPRGRGCDWRPEECTIDLEIVVRLSEAADSNLEFDLTRGDDANPVTVMATTESNVRAVSNILQVKSGHGVVMAGLIGTSETHEVAKVPILGDAPVVGYLFRSTNTTREKTETLVFVEAKVMPRSDRACCESAEDFALSRPYLRGNVLDNPLDCASYQVGQGSYLPPRSPDEALYWERHGRKVRKAMTECNDAFE
jgi:hypothetical protein